MPPTDPDLAPRHDWGSHYAAGEAPWDLGGSHPELRAWLAAGADAAGPHPGPGAAALVPGCGLGHDALALSAAGWCVDAVDAVDLLAATLGPPLAANGGRFLAANVLAMDFDRAYDLVYEHTIFCAIDPDQRAAFGAAMARAVAPGGRLVSLLYPLDKARDAGGPPHRATVEDLVAALGEAFELLEDAPCDAGHPRREYASHRLVFRRRG